MILYLQRSIFLYRHQITSPHITIIQATDYLKASIVIEFAGTPIRTAEELNHRIQRAIPYETIDVVVLRDGERLKIPVKMGRR